MKYQPDSNFAKFTTIAFQFTILNLLYLFLCLPIVTIGWTTASMFEVLLRYADKGEGYLIKDFFKALKTNWKPASIVYFSIGTPMAALFFGSIFWFSLKMTMSSVFAVILMVLAVYSFTALIYSLAIIGRFEASIKQTIKNALIFPILAPVRSFGLAVIPVVIFFFMKIFPVMNFLLLLCGFTVCIFCSSQLLLKTFAKHVAVKTDV